MTDEIRADVVQVLIDLVIAPSPDVLRRMQLLDRVTDAEQRAANDLILAALLASQDHRDRGMQVWDILLRRQWDSPPSWIQLFDELEERHVDQLRELYDVLPDGARHEFDRRYGRPEL
ncbi:hypothetical protein [Blastococcus sp. TF02A-35]|uniref:hypothetical protein n=1 Tax=Blastococcus sp. TF02A-35 TaxID=2559612 RepID=UPI0010732EC7|nr:hypothetical protein [Blastococcus sp. TF02A_35]TFV49525.1 hypothetical protein E4P43_11795 [Blastococcus sp. TF02A_35]